MIQSQEDPATTCPPQSLAELLAERRNTRQNQRRKSTSSADQAGKPWFIIAATVMILTTSTAILFFSNPESNKAQQTRSSQPATLPNAAAPPPPTLPAPPTLDSGAWRSGQSPILPLPVEITGQHFDELTASILTERQVPAPETIRLLEILNQFPLQFTGAAAIPPHPQGEASHPHLASLSIETTPCPWKPSASLLLIALRGNPKTACEVKLAFHAHPENVFRYRLLGSTTGSSPTPAASELPTRLAPNSVTLIAIEIESSRPGQALGELVWSTDSNPAPPLPIRHRVDAEPSDDARFAALVCTFALWLAGDPSGALDAEVIAALAREISTDTLSIDRADFLNLIARAIKL
jgi:hypothetical protein